MQLFAISHSKTATAIPRVSTLVTSNFFQYFSSQFFPPCPCSYSPHQKQGEGEHWVFPTTAASLWEWQHVSLGERRHWQHWQWGGKCRSSQHQFSHTVRAGSHLVLIVFVVSLINRDIALCAAEQLRPPQQRASGASNIQPWSDHEIQESVSSCVHKMVLLLKTLFGSRSQIPGRRLSGPPFPVSSFRLQWSQ